MVYTSQEYSFSLQISAKAGIVVWILLLATICIISVDTEQPVFIPSTSELSEAPPENKQGWLHPVIFEPQNKIQLTRSSYQVTTFLYFTPFMNGFLTVQAYIKNFKKDIKNPDYFNKIQHKSTNTGSSPLFDEQDYDAFLNSQYCLTLPFVCMTRLKIDRFILEVEYLDDIFDVTYRKFLNAIDHIEYHPSFQDKEEPIRK